MNLTNSLYRIIEPVPAIFPDYHPYALDINEALDPQYGAANCAVRAYAAGLLIRNVYPTDSGLYNINFGIGPDHATDFESKDGEVTAWMGHAIIRVWVPEQDPLIIDSDKDAAMDIPPVNSYQSYNWYDLDEGYRTYLAEAGHGDIEIDPDEILGFLNKRIEDLQGTRIAS